MRAWPPIEEPELLERLAMDDEEFFRRTAEFASALGRREFNREAYERALAYPWERPAGSYVLRGDRVEVLRELAPQKRRVLIEGFREGRHPLVSFGGNAAPSSLRVKFGHFPDQADREALVLTGYLHGVDVGAIAAPGFMGFIPATLFASPGTAVRAAVTWVTAAQATQLTWSEVSYRLGRLEDVRFEMDEADVEVEDLFAYISRFGALSIEGEPIALAAVPAKDRTASALTQEELLDVVAGMLLGPGSRAEDLMRAAFEDMAGLLALGTRLRENSQPLLTAWTPFAGGG